MQHLPGGDSGEGRVRLDDPLAVARHWADCGFDWLHVVDLDAAAGLGSNGELIRSLISETTAGVQVGGGIRDTETAGRLLDEGATRIMIGTRALEEPDWLGRLAGIFPGAIVVAADVRERRVVTRGWSRLLDRDVLDVIEELNDLPLAGVLVTAVHRQGSMRGADLFLVEDVAETSRHPLIAAGGIGSITDLRILADRGVSAVVLGAALYTGAIDPRQAADEFNQ